MNASKIAKDAQTPLKKFAYASTVTCSTQASAYGKCIAASYMDVRRDMCKEEFAKFAECLRTTLKRKW
ncbi:hypothetical protein D9756_005348 [Leucocoprinus leucothites]|uniref:Uncharacterized protein n=1 Tax=Leucocoprinus leucothites TaxID=201217 RepID=A0A8H5FZH1_9AGAR|nr:hypothetical protein D9756_005348 [Leucoagaricus leucothites]